MYTGDGDLERKVSIPEIKQVCGVVAVGGKRGKLAVVDGRREVVHFVKLSADLEVQQYTTKDVLLAAAHISLSGQRQLMVRHDVIEGRSLPCCHPMVMSLCSQYRPTTSRMEENAYSASSRPKQVT